MSCDECKRFAFENGVYICEHHEIYAKEKSVFEPCEWFEEENILLEEFDYD